MKTLEQQVIMIRQAKAGDIDQIWDILHANCRTCTLQQIAENINRMYVLTKGEKMLGILRCSLILGKQILDWVAIHPLYNEEILKELLIKGVMGTLQLENQGELFQETMRRRLSPVWSNQ